MITNVLDVTPSRHILVIADSCYAGIMVRGGFVRPNKATDKWIKALNEQKSRTLFTSGGKAPVPDSYGGEHSIFAKALIDFTLNNEEIINGDSLHKKISPGVTAVSDSIGVKQIPDYNHLLQAGDEGGDFFFVPRKATAQTQDRTPPEILITLGKNTQLQNK